MTSPPTRRMRPLNVGNVVSAGISLFRSHFKTFLGLSLKAILWFFVPVYGWARSIMIYAQIGRMGFQDLIHQPETVNQSLQRVEPKLWPFLGIGLLVTVLQTAVGYAISAVMGVIIVPLSVIGAAGETAAAVSGLLIVITQLLVFAGQMWVQARLFLWDMILAMEDHSDSTKAITRSWELTKGSGIRVLLVLLVTYLVILPLYGLMIAVPILVALPFLGGGAIADSGSGVATVGILLAVLLFLVLAFLIIVVTSPFFRTIKSVLYYDLCSRREGLDLKFRDRPQDRQGP